MSARSASDVASLWRLGWSHGLEYAVDRYLPGSREGILAVVRAVPSQCHPYLTLSDSGTKVRSTRHNDALVSLP